jgi:ribosome-binding factor A
MNERRRVKRIASLIKDVLGQLLVQEFQDQESGLITVSRVEVTPDLMTARVYVSLFGGRNKDQVMSLLEKRKGYLRKALASRVKLKYNPLLVFSLDPVPEYEDRIDQILEAVRKNEKPPGEPDQQ